MNNKKKRKVSLLSIVIATVFIVIIGVMVIILSLENRQRKEAEARYLKSIIDVKAANLRIDFLPYADRKYKKSVEQFQKRIDDFFFIEDNAFSAVHLSMWEDAGVSEELYERYFGATLFSPSFTVNSPQDIKDYIDECVVNKGGINTVYISLDPYKLYYNYYDKAYYDIDVIPYEEYLTDNLFSVFEKFVDVNFTLILPTFSVAYWASLDEEEVDAIFSNWYTFLMYLRWWPNVRTVFMGDKEWIINNPENYKDGKTLNGDVSEYAFLRMMSDGTYFITPPELEQRKEKILELRENSLKCQVKSKTLEGTKILFYGDSVFDYTKINSLSIPGVVEGETGAECFNFSVGGTTACQLGEDCFVKIAGMSAGRDKERFDNEGTELPNDGIYVVLYGINDYYNIFGVEEFGEALEYGIECIRKKSSNAKIVLATPYYISEVFESDDSLCENDILFEDYINVICYVAEKENVTLLDLYHNSGITAENSEMYLTDGVHPNMEANLLIAQKIIEAVMSE